MTKIPKPNVHYVREYKLDALSVSGGFQQGATDGAAGKSSFVKYHFECYEYIAAMSPLQRLKHGL